MARTQDEICERLAEPIASRDLFGFRAEVLIYALDYAHARPHLKPEVTEAEWDVDRMTDVELAARNYLTFAVGKIEDHRGISASRSVDKLREFAWLLGRDDVVAAMDAADYPQSGAPKVKAFAEGMGWDWPTGEDLARMAAGDPCAPGCREGCGG